MSTAPSAEFLQLQPLIAGRFSLERELGRGGMGVVFLARDVALDRLVAIKLLPPALAGQSELRERFLREARTVAKLSHPNIVPIHLVEEQGEVVFFVMTYVDGETLGQRVRRAGPLTSSHATRVMQEVAWALAYAHGRGVVHRDIKPDNIVLDMETGRAMVTDFGIARVAEGATLSGVGEIVGTAHYMSPEQVSGEPVDGRSDLFSLGVTMFFAVTGRLPFDAPNLPAIAMKVVNADAPRLVELRPDLPATFVETVHRCLNKSRDARFPSGEALAMAIDTTRQAVDVPPVIRLLLRDLGSLGFSLVLMLFLGFFLLPDMWAGLWPAQWTTVLALTAFAVGYPIQSAIAVLKGTRRVIKAGFSPRDVIQAMDRQERIKAEDDLTVLRESNSSVEGLSRWEPRWKWLAKAGVLVTVIVTAALFAGYRIPRNLVFPVFALGPVLIGAGVVGVGRVRRLIERREETERVAAGTKPDEEESASLNRFVRWLFRIASRGLRVSSRPEPPSDRPTELFLASAVAHAYSRLAPTLQLRFAEVPALIRKLESDAVKLRQRQDSVRLAMAITALEALRLDLLRLQAGIGSADDLTQDLERARAVGEAVDAELRAHSEVERVLGTRT